MSCERRGDEVAGHVDARVMHGYDSFQIGFVDCDSSHVEPISKNKRPIRPFTGYNLHTLAYLSPALRVPKECLLLCDATQQYTIHVAAARIPE